jgi:hypothetical protein
MMSESQRVDAEVVESLEVEGHVPPDFGLSTGPNVTCDAVEPPTMMLCVMGCRTNQRRRRAPERSTGHASPG